MAYLIFDLDEGVSFVYKCRRDAAEKLGLHEKTLSRWRDSGKIKKRGSYYVDCNCEIVGCTVRNPHGKGGVKKDY